MYQYQDQVVNFCCLGLENHQWLTLEKGANKLKWEDTSLSPADTFTLLPSIPLHWLSHRTWILLLTLSPPSSPIFFLPHHCPWTLWSVSPVWEPLQYRCLHSWCYWTKAANILVITSSALRVTAASPFVLCLSLSLNVRKDPHISNGGERDSTLTAESVNLLLCPKHLEGYFVGIFHTGLGWGGAGTALFLFKLSGDSCPNSQHFVSLSTWATSASHSNGTDM